MGHDQLLILANLLNSNSTMTRYMSSTHPFCAPKYVSIHKILEQDKSDL